MPKIKDWLLSCVDKDAGYLELSHIAGRSVNWLFTLENSLAVTEKAKHLPDIQV